MLVTRKKEKGKKLTSRENSTPPLGVSLKGFVHTNTAGTGVGRGLSIHVLNG
jgi:hypothetical protein